MSTVLNLNYFLYEIVHHCNLNCRSCDHCAPLAKEEFADIKKFEKDIRQMRKLCDYIGSFAIMGGEPLLHPKINNFIKISRKVLSNHVRISIYTNGIMLNSMDGAFWKEMRKNSIVLVITNYRLNIDYNRIIKTANDNQVMWAYEGNTGVHEKLMTKSTYDLEGKQDINIVSKNCYQGKVCRQVEDGRLYKCTICPAARHFNEYFHTNMAIDVKDSIDIYKAKKEEIIKYLSSPIPFCKYCNVSGREDNIKWGLSNRDISEWT